jgi:hypothetical protein
MQGTGTEQHLRERIEHRTDAATIPSSRRLSSQPAQFILSRPLPTKTGCPAPHTIIGGIGFLHISYLHVAVIINGNFFLHITVVIVK